MSQASTANNEWVKVLGKGMITIPKKWRDELGFSEGDVLRARKEGSKVIIEQGGKRKVPYRTYSDNEIEEMLKEDMLPVSLTEKITKDLS